MSLGFGRVIPKLQKVVPYNGKIADITHADTNKHTLDLAAALSENRKIIAVVLSGYRMAGTGYLRYFPNEGSDHDTEFENRARMVIIASGTNRLQYDLTVANDDFDLYCHGYVVEA